MERYIEYGVNERITQIISEDIKKNDGETPIDLFFDIQIECNYTKNVIEEYIENNIDFVCSISSSLKFIINLLKCYNVNNLCIESLIDRYIEIDISTPEYNTDKYIDILSTPKEGIAYLIDQLHTLKQESRAKKYLKSYLKYVDVTSIANILYDRYGNYALVYKAITSSYYYHNVDEVKGLKKYYYLNYPKVKDYAKKGFKRYYNYCILFRNEISSDDISILVKNLHRLSGEEVITLSEGVKNIDKDTRQILDSYIVMNKLA